mmetsp:Transcript_21322/g.47526  ORF Transcript_21322/g.47526 Transcript_21322/m.47526 type:complete len:373 (+) Transcript_21322:98-1216(+)
MLPYLGLLLGAHVCAIYLAGGLAHGVLSLLLAVGALRWLSLGPQPARGLQASKGESPSKGEPAKAAPRGSSAPGKPKLSDTIQAAMIPPGDQGLIDLGLGAHGFQENENCVVECMMLMKSPEASGPCNAYFEGKRRLWEARLQFRVKRTPTKPVVFGIELAEYVPVSGWSRRVQQMTVAMLRKVAGKDLYHSAGDDPRKTSGETERPGFAMPLWAFDQLVISEEGEEPNIRDLEGRGVLRTEGRADFVRTMNSLELQPGKVYTFSFWSISRFVDVLDWKMLGVVPGGMDFSVFCGRPPVHVVIYELEDSEDPRETRHLQSRKRYWFNLALWSTKVPPSQPQIRAMLWEGSAAEAAEEDTDAQEAQSSWCCWR